jgi:3D (Asp-Asp-Asp) domain-containing protein
MSKSLWGGSAAVALLSASLLFYAQPSVAETLAAASQDIQRKDGVQTTKAPGADVSPTTDAAGTVVAAGDAEKSNATEKDAVKVAALAVSAASELKEETQATAAPVLSFTATAYSLGGRTASGRPVSRGVIAADRRLLPIGTRVRLEAGSYSGEYVVADTGGSVRGRKIDIWVPNTGEAMRFGRRPVRLTVLARTRPRTASRQGRR